MKYKISYQRTYSFVCYLSIYLFVCLFIYFFLFCIYIYKCIYIYIYTYICYAMVVSAARCWAVSGESCWDMGTGSQKFKFIQLVFHLIVGELSRLLTMVYILIYYHSFDINLSPSANDQWRPAASMKDLSFMKELSLTEVPYIYIFM